MIVENIKKRLNEHNKNYLGIIVGETGSGKSMCGLELCTEIDPSFKIYRVCYTAEQFLEQLSTKIKAGSAILFEEVGVAADSRRWYSKANQAINYVMQTFRRENLAVIMTTPSFKFIDSNVRRLFHAYIETQRINRAKKICYTKYMNIQYNPRFDKLYFKHNRKKRGVVLKKVGFRLPNTKLLNAYEAKKKEYCDAIISKQKEALENEHKKNIKVDIKKIVEQVKDNYKKYLRDFKGKQGIDDFSIKLDYEISRDNARGIKKTVENHLRSEGVI